MGRPRKDSATCDVRERMSNAYFQLLETQPMDRITVGSITRAAECNRSTFYYHFDDLEELTDYLLETSLMVQGQSVSNLFAWAIDHPLPFPDPLWEQRLHFLALMAAHGGSERIATGLRDNALRIWQRALCADGEALDDEVALIVECGILSMLGSIIHEDPQGRTLADLPFPQAKERMLSPFVRELALFIVGQIGQRAQLEPGEIIDLLSRACREDQAAFEETEKA